ncbi:MAG: archease [Candidatus Omnitrophica bacterium]|nr:archease [Candidatus Omnitrophota bacterium]
MIPYEIIEHTAEIGILARGRTLKELFCNMASGMFSLIIPPDDLQSLESERVRASSDSLDTLLVAWLRELLFLFATKNFLMRSFDITRMDETSLEAVVTGERFDPDRHRLNKEIKAVTYCDLCVRQELDGTWVAQVIFDI